MAILNPFDADKWRALVAKFDAARNEFLAAFSSLRSKSAPTTELEKERQKLLKEAGPINASMNALIASLTTVRNWLKSIAGIFNFGDDNLSGLNALPLIGIGITLAGVSLVISAASAFVEKFKKYDALRVQVEAAAKAGATGEQIANIGKTPKEQREFFGIKAGAVPWVVGLVALVIAGPWIMKQIEARR